MDESVIQAKLKDNVPHPEFKENEQPVEDAPTEDLGEGPRNNLSLDNMVLKQQLLDFLDIPLASRKSPDTSTALESILNWAYNQTGTTEFADILRVINRQEGIMGSRLSGDRLFKLYKYVKINRQMEALTQQEKALYG